MRLVVLQRRSSTERFAAGPIATVTRYADAVALRAGHAAATTAAAGRPSEKTHRRFAQ